MNYLDIKHIHDTEIAIKSLIEKCNQYKRNSATIKRREFF